MKNGEVRSHLNIFHSLNLSLNLNLNLSLNL
jgi:hypothetical protein